MLPAADPNAATTATPSNGGNSKYVLIGIVLLLLILALALISITNKLDKVVNKTEETDVATTKKSRNKKIVKALLAIAVIAFILNIANGAIHLGRSQDYARTTNQIFSCITCWTESNRMSILSLWRRKKPSCKYSRNASLYELSQISSRRT
ncbi:MAG: hypothetical protein R2801_04515 [Chitinophagales bacterium]